MGANSNTESVWFLIVICIVAALATHVFTSHPPGEEDSPLPTGGYPLMETLDMLYGLTISTGSSGRMGVSSGRLTGTTMIT